MGVAKSALDEIEDRLGRPLPSAYRAYMQSHGPGVVETESDHYIEIWDLDNVGGINELPEVRSVFPYLLYFGGDVYIRGVSSLGAPGRSQVGRIARRA
jgi:hypothetical protein